MDTDPPFNPCFFKIKMNHLGKIQRKSTKRGTIQRAISRIVASSYHVMTRSRRFDGTPSPLSLLKGVLSKAVERAPYFWPRCSPPLLTTFVLRGLSTDLRPTIRRYREPPTYKIYFVTTGLWVYTRIVRVMVRVLQILVSNFLVQDSIRECIFYFIILLFLWRIFIFGKVFYWIW